MGILKLCATLILWALKPKVGIGMGMDFGWNRDDSILAIVEVGNQCFGRTGTFAAFANTHIASALDDFDMIGPAIPLRDSGYTVDISL